MQQENSLPKEDFKKNTFVIQDIHNREIDKIVSKKKEKGKVFFLCSWKNCSFHKKTWITEDILKNSFPETLKNYNRRMKILNTKILKSKERLNLVEALKNVNPNLAYGFSRNLKAEKILAAFPPLNGEKYHRFLIKWKSSDQYDIVSSNEANDKCPQVVINFYETKMTIGNCL